MVNFGPRDTVPEKFAGRQLLAHNPSVTLMRTNVVEIAQLGRILAEKLNHTKVFVEVHVPARGFSPISVQGGRSTVRQPTRRSSPPCVSNWRPTYLCMCTTSPSMTPGSQRRSWLLSDEGSPSPRKDPTAHVRTD